MFLNTKMLKYLQFFQSKLYNRIQNMYSHLISLSELFLLTDLINKTSSLENIIHWASRETIYYISTLSLFQHVFLKCFLKHLPSFGEKKSSLKNTMKTNSYLMSESLINAVFFEGNELKNSSVHF